MKTDTNFTIELASKHLTHDLLTSHTHQCSTVNTGNNSRKKHVYGKTGNEFRNEHMYGHLLNRSSVIKTFIYVSAGQSCH